MCVCVCVREREREGGGGGRRRMERWNKREGEVKENTSEWTAKSAGHISLFLHITIMKVLSYHGT